MTDLLTPEAVADMLGCTTDTINDKLARHELPGIKLGRAWRLPAGALMKHLEDEALRHVKEGRPSEVRAVQVAKRAAPRLVI